MTTYRTGRSADYSGSETPKQYAANTGESTANIVAQFERMARGLAPVTVRGDVVAWVQDDTLTPELRAWCAETAAMVRREAELKAALKPRAKAMIRRSVSQIEADIAAVLSMRPDATAHDVRIVTGLDTQRIVRSEAWILAHMGKRGEE